jgi:hypothetical protein
MHAVSLPVTQMCMPDRVVGVFLQVLRVLMTVMSDFGYVPMAQRKPPVTLGPNAAKHLRPLAQQAVVALQVRVPGPVGVCFCRGRQADCLSKHGACPECADRRYACLY